MSQWVESDHKRDDGGRFTSGGGSGGASSDVAKVDGHRADGAGEKGKEVKLNDRENARHYHIHSEKFKAWFGNWEKGKGSCSQVVDARTGEPKETHALPDHHSEVAEDDGKPRVVFHGTPGRAFDEFDKSKLRDAEALVYGDGFYFAEDKSLAERYSKGESGKASGEIMTCYLNIRKPFRVSKRYSQQEYERITGQKLGYFSRLNRKMSGKPEGYSGDEIYNALVKKHGGRKAANAVLKQQGFDGIHTSELNGDKTEVWVAFEPSQIKSIDNEGTFDPASNNIRKGGRLGVLKGILDELRVIKGEWDESKHKRDHGKFSSTGGGGKQSKPQGKQQQGKPAASSPHPALQALSQRNFKPFKVHGVTVEPGASPTHARVSYAHPTDKTRWVTTRMPRSQVANAVENVRAGRPHDEGPPSDMRKELAKPSELVKLARDPHMQAFSVKTPNGAARIERHPNRRGRVKVTWQDASGKRQVGHVSPDNLPGALRTITQGKPQTKPKVKPSPPRRVTGGDKLRNLKAWRMPEQASLPPNFHGGDYQAMLDGLVRKGILSVTKAYLAG
jgi:hypothetical protein